MVQQLIQLFLLLSFSLVSVAVVYYKIPSSQIQQVIAVLVVVLLIVNRFIAPRYKQLPFGISLALLTLVSAFLQLLILSSGGFYSPFLILFHLFTIVLSFLVNIRVAIGFISFSVIALIASTLLDPKLYGLFINDPWSVVLYLLSFAVIIPIYQLVSNSYHLEQAISKILSTQLQIKGAQLELTKKRGESLLGGLSELVIVTDLGLKILSINEATVRILKISSTSVLGIPIFDILYLKSLNGQTVDRQFLSLDEVIEKGEVHVVNDLLLYTKNTSLPKKINVRVCPTRNLEGQIDQIIFIIPNPYSEGSPNIVNQNIEQAILMHGSLLASIKNELKEKNMQQMQVKIEFLGKTEEAILKATEIVSYGIKPNFNLVDSADLMQHLIENEKDFAGGLGIPLEFSLSKEFLEQFTIDLRGRTVPVNFTSKYFTVLIEPRWFDFMMEKILDLAILLSTRGKQPHVNVFMSYDQEKIIIDVGCIYHQPVSKDFEKSLLGDYHGLESDPDKILGSGLEGYLIKTISALLNIPVNLTYNNESSTIYFRVQLSKEPIQ